MTTNRSPLRRRFLPYVDKVVNIRWNSRNDHHADEHIEGGKVVGCGPTTIWIDAPEAGVKERQDVFIKYDQVQLIEEATT